MSDDEMKALVAEARRHAEALINGTETGDADLLHDMAYALEAAQETIAAFIIGGAVQPADDVYQTSIAHPAEETEELRARIDRAREAWWSATEQGDNGLVYTDRIEDAMDEIWNEIGHAEWRPSIGCNICGESLPDAEPHLCRPVPEGSET